MSYGQAFNVAKPKDYAGWFLCAHMGGAYWGGVQGTLCASFRDQRILAWAAGPAFGMGYEEGVSGQYFVLDDCVWCPTWEKVKKWVSRFASEILKGTKPPFPPRGRER